MSKLRFLFSNDNKSLYNILIWFLFGMNSWEQQKKQEQEQEKKVRGLMNKHRITYHEALDLVTKGQKGLFDF